MYVDYILSIYSIRTLGIDNLILICYNYPVSVGGIA